MNNFETLYQKALKINPERKLSDLASCGGCGSALLTENGKTYTGICIDAACGLGFCAEHSAIAEMLKNGESRVAEIIAVMSDGNILPPCGRCRELLSQINPGNKETVVHVSQRKSRLLSKLLPESYS